MEERLSLMVVVSIPLLLHKLEILLHYEKNAILRSGVAVKDVKFALEKIWSSLKSSRGKPD